MCAIEKITSRTRKIKIPNPEAEGGYEKIEVCMQFTITCLRWIVLSQLIAAYRIRKWERIIKL